MDIVFKWNPHISAIDQAFLDEFRNLEHGLTAIHEIAKQWQAHESTTSSEHHLLLPIILTERQDFHSDFYRVYHALRDTDGPFRFHMVTDRGPWAECCVVGWCVQWAEGYRPITSELFPNTATPYFIPKVYHSLWEKRDRFGDCLLWMLIPDFAIASVNILDRAEDITRAPDSTRLPLDLVATDKPLPRLIALNNTLADNSDSDDNYFQHPSCLDRILGSRPAPTQHAIPWRSVIAAQTSSGHAKHPLQLLGETAIYAHGMLDALPETFSPESLEVLYLAEGLYWASREPPSERAKFEGVRKSIQVPRIALAAKQWTDWETLGAKYCECIRLALNAELLPLFASEASDILVDDRHSTMTFRECYEQKKLLTLGQLYHHLFLNGDTTGVLSARKVAPLPYRGFMNKVRKLRNDLAHENPLPRAGQLSQRVMDIRRALLFASHEGRTFPQFVASLKQLRARSSTDE